MDKGAGGEQNGYLTWPRSNSSAGDQRRYQECLTSAETIVLFEHHDCHYEVVASLALEEKWRRSAIL